MTGDGTQIGKRLHVLNFGFTLLDDEEIAYSAAGHHCIAIIKEPEKYHSLILSLEDIKVEVESLSTIEVNGICFDIVYFLGGDWKFLATITGIDSATANYACIWCKCPSIERHNSKVKWSMTDIELGARTIEENVNLASKRSKKYNVSHPPIFPKIPLNHVVLDNLHLFLRVADVLIDMLIGALRTLDRINQSLRIHSLDGLTHLAAYESALKRIGISGFSFYIGKNSQKLKWRSLTGPEKVLLFTKLNLIEHFPDVSDINDIQKLWKEFYDINGLFSAKPSEIINDHIEIFEKRSNHLWIILYKYILAKMSRHICIA